jgi:hypothetical protein
MATEVQVAEIPNCDLCPKGKELPAEYDGRTAMGPWAFMCGGCWSRYGVGQLGTGYGQRLILREG